MKNKWFLKATFLTLFLSIFFNLIMNTLGNLNNILLIICIFAVVFIGILFDIIGTAVLSCNIKTFNAQASKKIKGAKEAIKIAKNSSLVSNICNDVIGDICGIITGSLVAMLIINLFQSDAELYYSILITSLISAITVGGKAFCKTIGIKKSDKIVFLVGKFLSIFSKKNSR